MADLTKMEAEDLTFWTGLVKKYLLGGANVTVRGVPSVAEQQRMAEEEKERVSHQRTTLGAEGLQKRDEMLTQAMQQNEVLKLMQYDLMSRPISVSYLVGSMYFMGGR